MTSSRTYRVLGLALAGFTVLFLLFGSGALGIVGDGGPADLLYLVPAGLGVLAALAVRFRSTGMVLVLAGLAVVTLLAGLVAILAGLPEQENGSVLDVVGLSLMYGGLYAASAWLLRRSASPV